MVDHFLLHFPDLIGVKEKTKILSRSFLMKYQYSIITKFFVIF